MSSPRKWIALVIEGDPGASWSKVAQAVADRVHVLEIEAQLGHPSASSSTEEGTVWAGTGNCPAMVDMAQVIDHARTQVDTSAQESSDSPSRPPSEPPARVLSGHAVPSAAAV